MSFLSDFFDPASPAAGRSRRFTILLVVAVVLSNAVAVSLGVFTLHASLSKAEEEARHSAQNLVGLLDQSFASSGRTIDIVLRTLVDELAREEVGGSAYLESDEIESMLERYAQWLPEIETIRVYDDSGNLHWSSAPSKVPTANIASLPYFATLREQRDAGLVVSSPQQAAAGDGWGVSFARRIDGPNGRFAGVVVATTPVSYLTAQLSRPNLGPKGYAVLRYSDYALIARYPQAPGRADRIGQSWPPEAMGGQTSAGQRTVTFHARDADDGLERFLAMRRIEGMPFVIVVGVADDDYLQQWYRDVWQTVVLLSIFLLATAASAALVATFYRRQQDDAIQVRESNVRLAAALDELSARDRSLAVAERLGKLGVYSIDLTSNQTVSSSPLRDVFGLPRDQPFDVEDWRALVHPEDRWVIERFTVGLVQDGEPFDYSYRIVRPDGTERWVHGVGLLDRDATGAPVSVHGAVQDITEYKQVESSLQHALEDYQKLVTRIPIGVFGYRWKPSGETQFIHASPRFCEQMGLSIEDVMTDPRQVFERIHPDDLARLLSARMGPGGVPQDFAWKGRIRVGDKTRWFDLIARPTRLEDGSVLWEGVQADVTDRKLAELARRESEERYRLLLQYSPVGILQYDTDLKVVYCNLQFAHIMSTPHAYMLALDCKQLKDQRILPAMRAALAGELGAYQGGYRTTYSDKEMQVAASCAPLRDASDTIIGGIIILQDITERIRKDEEMARYRDSLEERVAARTTDLEAARAEAERLSRVKSEFLANMSHEIRTPLNGVLGLARMGYRDSPESDTAHTTFGRIVASGQLLLGIINDILDFSKIEAGKLRIEAIEVDLHKLVGDTLALMDERATEKGLALHLHALPTLPAACVSDPLRIGQILVNLLSNAIKFTEHGSVTLEAGADGGQIVLRVRDTGIGMSPDDLAKVFAPFEQADNSTTRRFGGTGLGLTITHRIVDLMGGTLQAQSVVGQGSTFEVRLPLVHITAPPVEEISPSNEAEVGSRLAGLRVLVAEDNEVNQLVLEDYLLSEGAEVVMTGNGQEAVDRVQAGDIHFDVVLMDVQMPVMDGHTATRRLRAIAPELPVIGQTAHALDEEREACMAAGMVDHLAKPIDPDLMVDAIRRHCPPRH